ncbi:ABC transporter permease [Nocardiopsis sp. HNM0947]|uniref:ABC transporter permease n=1 Tax=Nocardiopsis coralli TaxID=2772213 RepID=A0ABR9PAT5_9ACTN|nr:ABC transporter permease [Nocardiopsis coralli]MBE3000956.1 ABC transporter permease [Nocardiopsis coralli]
MNPVMQAVRVGASRGRTDFVRLSTTPGELFGYLFYPAVFVGLAATLNFDHNTTGVDGSGYFVAGGVVFALVTTSLLTLAQLIGTEREDGTLLRAKALPHGMLAYTVGKALQLLMTCTLSVGLVLVAALLLVDGFTLQGWGGALTLAWVCALGALALIPLGAILGSLTTNPRVTLALTMVVLLALMMVSGVFFPTDFFPAWVGAIGMALPLYWVGVGVRAAALPGSDAAFEASGAWDLPQAAGVLMVWAVVGFLVAPWVLRAMARRESGSRVDRARERAMKRAY